MKRNPSRGQHFVTREVCFSKDMYRFLSGGKWLVDKAETRRGRLKLGTRRLDHMGVGTKYKDLCSYVNSH